jgi:acyl-CoA thioester hydrolase
VARYTAHCQIRWSDMDAFGHVNNARFLTLFEEARTELIARIAAQEGLSGLMSGVVIARHEIDYLRPIDYQPDPVRIDTWVVEVRNVSFTVGYEMFDHDGGEVVARAQTKMVPYDLSAGRPRRLNPVEKTFLEAWLLTAPDHAAQEYAARGYASKAARLRPLVDG